jgi:hypothetical protein
MGGEESRGINQPLTEEEAKAQRKTVRKRVLWKARIEIAGTIRDCAVVDLSLGGARLHLAERVALGTSVRLILDRFGAFRGEVVWQRDRGMGLRFTDDPQRIADLIGTRLPLERARAAAAG